MRGKEGRFLGGGKLWMILHGKDAEILVDAQRLNLLPRLLSECEGI